MKNLLVFLLIFLFSGHVFADDYVPITAQSWVIADQAGNILKGYNTNDVRSIASITKLMTVMVVLDSNPSLSAPLPKQLYRRIVSRRDLIDIAIVRSDNNAARMLCDTYYQGYKKCIDAMNNKAKSLGMNNTMFVDPIGIHNSNVSTAEDLVKLVNAASNYPIIVQASNIDKITWHIGRKKDLLFKNTNSMVGKGIDFVVSKTGSIKKAGGCVVMMLNTINGIRTVVLLGSRNNKTRIPEARLLSLSV